MVRVAALLWIVLAVIVWNDVFDQVIINAGRHYLFDAFASAATGGPFLHMADAMRPAITRATWAATAAAAPILIFGLAACRFASRRGAPLPPQVSRADHA